MQVMVHLVSYNNVSGCKPPLAETTRMYTTALFMSVPALCLMNARFACLLKARDVVSWFCSVLGIWQGAWRLELMPTASNANKCKLHFVGIASAIHMLERTDPPCDCCILYFEPPFGAVPFHITALHSVNHVAGSLTCPSDSDCGDVVQVCMPAHSIHESAAVMKLAIEPDCLPV